MYNKIKFVAIILANCAAKSATSMKQDSYKARCEAEVKVLKEAEKLQFEEIKSQLYAENQKLRTELKEAEILRERLDMLGNIDSYIGTFFSKEYVLKSVLNMNDSEIEFFDGNKWEKDIEKLKHLCKSDCI